MARSEVKALWHLRFSVAKEAEEATSLALHSVFGIFPTVYLRSGSKTVTLNVYLDPSRRALGLKKKFPVLVGILATTGLPIKRASMVRLAEQDWAESWKRHFKPINLGGKLRVQPSWIVRPRTFRGKVVVLDPGLSFGTGLHPTTRFCLRQIVKAASKSIPGSMLDVGSGSGILAIAAAKLGFKPVSALDIDPHAVRIARANMRRNRVVSGASVRQCDWLEMPLRTVEKYDLICANLVHDTLVEGATRLAARLARGGTLVLAGILRTQFARIRSVYEALGFHIISQRVEREWHSIALRELARERSARCFYPGQNRKFS